MDLRRRLGVTLLLAALGAIASADSVPRTGPAEAGTGPRRVHLVWVDATVLAGGARGKVMYATRAVGATTWTIREIDSALFGNPFTTTATVELVLDSAGNPHVAWVHCRTKELRFARWDGGAWVRMDGTPGHDVLDTDVDYSAVAKNFLVLRGDRPHVVFRQSTNLRYYRWNGRAWKRETALTLHRPDSNPGGNPALAIDARGVVHVAHHNFGDYRIRYARRDGERWTDAPTSSPGMNSLYKWIALDRDGRPHVAFQGGYMRYDGARWVDAAGAPGYDALDARFVSAGLTPSGEILLGVRTPEGLAVRRKALDAAVWAAPELAYPSTQFLSADLESDRNGVAHAALSAGGMDALDIVYVHRDGARWVAETVATTPGFHRFVHPSIAVE